MDGERCKPAIREHRRSALQVTGITVAPGHRLMARVYDKSTELALPGREAKVAIEHARWREKGWDGSAQVTRVEFQHRGEYLDEIDLRDPYALGVRMDAVWQRDVQWLRLVEAGSATRSVRARLDRRWLGVRDTRFRHEAAPVSRSRRHRGGARPEHVFGTALSRLAAAGDLRALALDTTSDGEVLTEQSLRFLDERDLSRWIERTTLCIFGAAASDVLRHGTRGPDLRTAAIRLFAKIKGAEARFSSIDDEASAP